MDLRGADKSVEEVIANQQKILDNQRRIVDNQEKLDDLLALNEMILDNQESIRANQAKMDMLLANHERKHSIKEMIGASPSFKEALKKAQSVAHSDAAVLIKGETGTGKELLARAIHAQSSRSHLPLVTVNCAALPSSLAESELFGYEKGAFTGAFQRKPGWFEVTDGGTLFLDEIGEVPIETQTKFLRVLQEGEIKRIGGMQTIRVNVRIIAATNQPLERLVAERKFRSDLFYRLDVFPILLPPLRERREDILLLINYFAKKYRARFKKAISSVSEDSIKQLQEYHWPGNIRQLEHVIQRAVLTAEGEILTIDLPPPIGAAELPIDSLPDAIGQQPRTGLCPGRELVSLAENERAYILRVLDHTRGRISGKDGAAAILGLHPSTLRSRMKKLDISNRR